MKSFKKSDLTKQLTELSFVKQLLFGASCCQRMLYSYQCFLKDVDKSEDKLSPLLGFVWEYLESGGALIKEWPLLVEDAYSLIPDTEDYESDFTGYAQNACISVYYVLKSIASHEQIEKVVNIAVFIIDTADWIVQDNLFASGMKIYSEDDIESHQIMQKELNHQSTDLSLLKQNIELSIEIVDKIYNASLSSQLNPKMIYKVE